MSDLPDPTNDLPPLTLPVDDAVVRSTLRTLGRARDPNWLYDLGTGPRSHPYQGDVLADAPLAYVGVDGRARVVIVPGLLISHGCDLPGDDGFAVVAPISSVSRLFARWAEREGITRAEGRREAMRRNELTPYVYLPAVTPAMPEESYADLSRVASIPGRVADALPIRLRLSQNGWYVLVLKLQMHWCRMERAGDYPRAGAAAP